MKGLSIKQPWLYLISKGIKKIETRVWNTKYRGDILLCSSKIPMVIDYSFYQYYNIDKTDTLIKDGYALAVGELYDVTKMVKSDEKLACCDLYDSYSWHFKNIRLIEPFQVKGGLKLFNVDMYKDKIIWK